MGYAFRGTGSFAGAMGATLDHSSLPLGLLQQHRLGSQNRCMLLRYLIQAISRKPGAIAAMGNYVDAAY